MIKVANLVSLLAAPIIVKYPMFETNGSVNFGVVAVAIAMLAATIWAIARSKSTPVVLQTTMDMQSGD
jgi:hypothetical protein